MLTRAESEATLRAEYFKAKARAEKRLTDGRVKAQSTCHKLLGKAHERYEFDVKSAQDKLDAGLVELARSEEGQES